MKLSRQFRKTAILGMLTLWVGSLAGARAALPDVKQIEDALRSAEPEARTLALLQMREAESIPEGLDKNRHRTITMLTNC